MGANGNRKRKEGEEWVIFSINLSEEEHNEVNKVKGKRTRAGYFVWLHQMYVKALGRENEANKEQITVDTY